MGKHRERNYNKGDEYIQSYPELGKWIKQCVQCQARGHDPNMPDIVGSPIRKTTPSRCFGVYVARNIKRFFEPLVLNECGLCSVCSKYQE